jgi:hypothetical protein
MPDRGQGSRVSGHIDTLQLCRLGSYVNLGPDHNAPSPRSAASGQPRRVDCSSPTAAGPGDRWPADRRRRHHGRVLGYRAGVRAVVATRVQRRTAFVVALPGTSMPVLGMAFLPPYPAMLAFGFATGLFFGPINPMTNIAMQERTPTALRGRVVGAIGGTAYATGPWATCSRDHSSKASALRTLVERLEVLHVHNAREHGRSWEQIAALAGQKRDSGR